MLKLRITKLHFIMCAMIMMGISYWGYAYYQQAKTEQQAAEDLRLQGEQYAKAQKEQLSAQRYREQRENQDSLKEDAEELIAVAEEMLEKGYADGKDISLPELTVNQAKSSFKLGKYKQASSLARQSIEEVKQAPLAEEDLPVRRSGSTVYTVKRGDSLWNIAKNNEHYGLGSKWVGIWRKNEGKIPDFDIIYPGQQIVIPAD